MTDKINRDDFISLFHVLAQGLGVTSSDESPRFLEAIAMQLGAKGDWSSSTLIDELAAVNGNLSSIATSLDELVGLVRGKSEASGE